MAKYCAFFLKIQNLTKQPYWKTEKRSIRKQPSSRGGPMPLRMIQKKHGRMRKEIPLIRFMASWIRRQENRLKTKKSLKKPRHSLGLLFLYFFGSCDIFLDKCFIYELSKERGTE